MGYETKYYLEVEVESEGSYYEEQLTSEIIEDLRASNEHANCALHDDGSFNQPTKWYYHQEDLIKFSKKYLMRFSPYLGLATVMMTQKWMLGKNISKMVKFVWQKPKSLMILIHLNAMLLRVKSNIILW